jgi:outer membrane protein
MTGVSMKPIRMRLDFTPRSSASRFSHRATTAALLLILSAFRAKGQPAPAGTVPSPSSVGPSAMGQPRDARADLESELQSLQARPGGLTAAQAAERAVAVSHDLAASRHREAAADADIDAAKIRYAPRLTLGAGYTRYSPVDAPTLGMLVVAPNAQSGQVNPPLTVAHPFSFPVLLNQTVLRASLVLPLTDYFLKFPQLLDASKSGKNVAQFNQLAARARTLTEAKVAYYSWTRAVLQEVAARQARRRALDHLTDTKRAFNAGLATNADYRAVEAQVAQSELLETRATNNVVITAEQVRLQLRFPPETRLEIGETIIAAPALPRVPRLDQAWQEAQQSRPELMAFSQSERQLRQQADAQTASELPRIDALGEILTANPNPRYQPPVDAFKTTWAVGVQATWTVNDWPSSAAQKRGLEAQADAIAAQREALKESLRAEIISASRGVEQAATTIEATQRGVDAAETAYRARRDQYLAGRATNVELTDAETELTRARIDNIDALVDARIAAVRLAYALGRTTPSTP